MTMTQGVRTGQQRDEGVVSVHVVGDKIAGESDRENQRRRLGASAALGARGGDGTHGSEILAERFLAVLPGWKLPLGEGLRRVR